MALAFAGTAPFGAGILRHMCTYGDVALVISQPDRPAGRGRKLKASAVAMFALEQGIPLLRPERMHDPEVLAALREAGVDTIVVAAFGQMIREPLLSDYLMINVHGSLLPKYRGAAPIERSIMDGCAETGIAIMQMDAGLDTGPVAKMSSFPILENDCAGDIYAKAAEVGGNLLREVLTAAAKGEATFDPQPESGETYAHKIVPDDRVLSADDSVQTVHNTIRGLSPHIGAWFSFSGQRVVVWQSRIATDEPSDGHSPGDAWAHSRRLFVQCADGVVELVNVQPSGKRAMAAGDWIQGLRDPLERVDAAVVQSQQ